MTEDEKEELIKIGLKVKACKIATSGDKWVEVPGHTRVMYAHGLLNRLLTDGPWA